MAGLELVLQDFKEISERAFELRDKQNAAMETDQMESFSYAMMLVGWRFYDEDSLVWYDGREGYMPEDPIGTPNDYLAIRDDYDTLKAFIAKTLDRGKVHAGGGTHGDSSRETNCAEYIMWLHQHNENQDFKANLEKAVLELLDAEFEKELSPYDFDSALKKATEEFETGFAEGNITKAFFNQDIGTTRWRYGIDFPNTPEEKAFREWYDEELEPTIRVDPEYCDQKCTHFEETSPEFQEAFRQRFLIENAQKMAIREFSPQFNRLIGLMDVVASLGEGDERFASAYDVLKKKAEEGYMINSPSIVHHYSASDIYQKTLIALSSVQTGIGLEEFWLDNIQSDFIPERVIASVHGLLTMQDSPEARLELIPSLLDRLQKRKSDLDSDYHYSAMIGFISEANLLDDVLGHINRLCFPEKPDKFSHLDKERATLDFLDESQVGVGQYTLKFTRYDSRGAKDLTATFNVVEDTIGGDTDLEPSIRAYLDRKGYELPNDVWVTSLEGRRISGAETKIVNPDGEDLDGFYEGIVGLNYTPMPFLYDESTGALLIAEPVKSRTLMFGVDKSSEKRRTGLDKLEELVPYADFVPLTELGERVNELVEKRKKEGGLADSIYGLEDCISEEIRPYLTSIISGRLIQNSDGLVE